MFNVNELIGASSGSLGVTDEESSHLRQRLGLYQVFLKLYEQNRGLLDEILNLEDVGGRGYSKVSTPYIQGVIMNETVYLATNLVNGTTQVVTQPDQIWTLGRDRRQVAIAVADSRLSRAHAAIKYDSSRRAFCLIDLESTNGTFVNGECLKTKRYLNDGDRVRLGSIGFTFFIGLCTHTAQPTPPDLLSQIERIEAKSSVNYSLEEGLLEPAEMLKSSYETRTIMGTCAVVPDETLTFLRSIHDES